jgi:hypothetical protein
VLPTTNPCGTPVLTAARLLVPPARLATLLAPSGRPPRAPQAPGLSPTLPVAAAPTRPLRAAQTPHVRVWYPRGVSGRVGLPQPSTPARHYASLRVPGRPNMSHCVCTQWPPLWPPCPGVPKARMVVASFLQRATRHRIARVPVSHSASSTRSSTTGFAGSRSLARSTDADGGAFDSTRQHIMRQRLVCPPHGRILYP